MPFKYVAMGLKVVSASMMANPVVWIVGAVVVAVAAAAYLIYKNWNTVKTFFMTWWDTAKTGWNVIGEAIKAPFVMAFEWIGSKMEWLKGKWDGLKSVFSSGASATPGGNSAMGFSTSQLALPGHAAGGIFNKPHIAAFAEGGKKEAAIPLEGNKDNARSIWTGAGQALGMFEGKQKSTPSPISEDTKGGIFNKPPSVTRTSQSTSSTGISIEKGAIVIHAAPGMDVAALASEVMRRIEQKMGQKQRRSFSDATFAG